MIAAILGWGVAGYLLGSVPTAYLVARKLRGIDIRRYGSRNVGGTNVYYHVGRAAGILVGLADVLKAAAPTFLAAQLHGPEAAAAAGTGAILGHCWSLYLRFTGGRGLATTLGAFLPLHPWASALILLLHFAGGALHLAPVADLAALISIPAIGLVFFHNTLVGIQGALIVLAVCAKRLHANGLPLPPDKKAKRAVLMNRLLYDRDVPPGAPWNELTPESQGPPGT
jgi:glycerol-3-phosphate acyltransferase PlsY